MNNPRGNIAHILLAAGGAVLALSTFLSWLEETSLWETASFLDIAIFVLALATAAIAVMHITGAAANQPRLRGELADWVGLIPATLAIGLVLDFAFGPAENKIGSWIAFLASLAIIAGLVLRERPDLAAKLNDATSGIGSGQPGAGGGQPGVGAGPAAGQGGFGQGGGAAAAPGPGPSAQPQQPQSPPQQPQSQPQTAPQPVASPAAQPAGGESGGPAPGWYPDPQGQKRLRYWDGSRWTEQTSD